MTPSHKQAVEPSVALEDSDRVDAHLPVLIPLSSSLS